MSVARADFSPLLRDACESFGDDGARPAEDAAPEYSPARVRACPLAASLIDLVQKLETCYRTEVWTVFTGLGWGFSRECSVTTLLSSAGWWPGQGQGLHRVWLRGPDWAEPSLLAALSCLWGCAALAWLCWTGGAPKTCARNLSLDFCRSFWRRDLVCCRELKDLVWRPEESKSERARRVEKVASSAGPSQRPFPWGPRNREALRRQVENPSRKDCFWPLLVCSLVVFWRKMTVCSRISAFSTLCLGVTCATAAAAWINGSSARGQKSTQSGSEPTWWGSGRSIVLSLSRLRFILSLRRFSTWDFSN